MNDEYKIIEERNSKLVLENRKLKNEVDKLREEKYNLYHYYTYALTWTIILIK